jgi:hypothetical protein
MISGLSDWTWITVPPIYNWNTEELKAFVYWVLEKKAKISEYRSSFVNSAKYH